MHPISGIPLLDCIAILCDCLGEICRKPTQRDHGAFKSKLQATAKRAEAVREDNQEKYKTLFENTEFLLLRAAEERHRSCVVNMVVPEGYANVDMFLQGFCEWVRENRELYAVVRDGNKVEFSWFE